MEHLQYHVSVAEPRHHRIHVRLEASGLTAPARVALPGWSPGSYMIREYARRVEGLRASTPEGQPLDARKVRKDTWEISGHAGSVVIEYAIAGLERSPRFAYLDEAFGLYTGCNTLMFIEGATDRAARVELSLPSGWSAYCSRIEGFVGTAYEAPDYDVLADTPVTLGPELEVVRFEACGKPHAMVVAGTSSADMSRFVPDTIRVLETTARYFDNDVPYDRYLFHVVMSGSVRGGLEHLDSSVLIYPRLWLHQSEKYVNFMRLVAHEYFHVWNIKRIRPDTLGPFDYRNENYTRELWVAEGWTSYVQFQILLWSGLMTREEFLAEQARRIERHEARPGRHEQSLEDASFDAWIKFYRRDGDAPNNLISYYLKGSLAAMALDMELIGRGHAEEGLRALLLHLWKRFAKEGWPYPEGSIPAQIEAVTGTDYSAWFERHVRSTEDIAWDEALACVGLRLVRTSDEKPQLGVRLSGCTVNTVLREGPAWDAGLLMDDELVAIDGLRATSSSITDIVGSKAVGDRVEVSFFRDDVLHTTEVELAPSPNTSVELVPVDSPTPAQNAALELWWQGP